MTNKELYNMWKLLRDNPRDVDIANAFNNMCTPYQVHLLIQDQEDLAKDCVKVLHNLCKAYRMATGLEGAYDSALQDAERLLKELEIK